MSRAAADSTAVSRAAADSTADTDCPPSASMVESVGWAVLRRWWREARPKWVHAGWFDLEVRPAVRRAMRLEPGAKLVEALSSLDRDWGFPGGARVLGDGSVELPGGTRLRGDGRVGPSGAARFPGVADGSGPGVPTCMYPHQTTGAPGEPDPGTATGFPCGCLLVVAAAWAAVAEWAAARAQSAVIAVAGPQPVELPAIDRLPRMVDPAREELALALRLSPASAANRIAAARNLAEHPDLARAVAVGLCSGWTARQLLADTAGLESEQRAGVLAELLGKLDHRHRTGSRAWTSGESLAAARRIRLRRFPDSARRSAARARSERRVYLCDQGDGVTDLVAVLPTVDAERIHRRLTALAAGLDDPTRTCDQKRADLLSDLVLSRPSSAASPADSSAVGSGGATGDCGDDSAASESRVGPQGPGTATGVEVCVVVSLETLLRLADEPAHLTGLGPIDADTARELAADGRWRAWVTDPAARVMATGSRTYTPSAALARLIRAREPWCRMPGCRRPAAQCDLDHSIPYPQGPTSAQNLGPLCRRHHNQKTRRRWRLRNAGDGYTWTTPSGWVDDGELEPPLDSTGP